MMVVFPVAVVPGVVPPNPNSIRVPDAPGHRLARVRRTIWLTWMTPKTPSDARRYIGARSDAPVHVLGRRRKK